MSEWISVKERLPERLGLLPEETEYVLVFVTYPSGGGYVSICGYESDGWSEWDSMIDTDMISHWLPLPEPPKEDK